MVTTLLMLQLGASVSHARDDNNAPRGEAVATASAQVLVLCDVSSRPAPGCPTTSLSPTSTNSSSARTSASPGKANGLAAHTTVILNFE